MCLSSAPLFPRKVPEFREHLEHGSNMAAVCIHVLHKRFSHSLKSGQARNNFVSTLKQGLVTFQDGGSTISLILLLPIPPQIIFQNRCFDVCTLLASTHRYTKDSYSIMGIARGGVKVCFYEGM